MRTHATTAEHLALTPPAGGRWGVPTCLAMGVHALLVLALAWGVSWRDEPQLAAVSTELWSRLPQEAVPVAVAPPPSSPEPEPERPTPTSPSPPPAPPQAQAQKNANIGLRQRDKAAKNRAAKADAEKKQRDEAALQKSAQAKQAEARKNAKQVALDKNRREQIQRQLAQIGATTSSGDTAQAAQSSGPSASYEGIVNRHLKPHIRFADDLSGAPKVVVRVTTTPRGDITSIAVSVSSGHKAWDDAVVRGINRMGSMPPDKNGLIPTRQQGSYIDIGISQ